MGWIFAGILVYLLVGCLSALWVYHPFPTKENQDHPAADFFAVVCFWPLLLLVVAIGKFEERVFSK